MHEPSMEEWGALYQAAIEFSRASPWASIDNEDLFEIVDPGTGQSGYCSVLGNGGQEFGLVIFLGQEGLAGYAKLVTDKPGKADSDDILMTPVLTLLFASRNELDKADRQVIRSLDLTFRGRNAWPLFRSQKPGYMPWYLEQAEACFLTIALQQALSVAERVRKGELDLVGNHGRMLAVRQVEGQWKEKWLSLPIPGSYTEPDLEPLSGAEQARLELIRSQGRPMAGTWELDISLLHMPIEDEGDRPYFPLYFLVMEREQGLIIDTSLTAPWISQSAKQEAVISMLEKASQLPEEVWVASRKNKAFVEPITSSLGIKIRVRALNMARDVKVEMTGYLSKGS